MKHSRSVQVPRLVVEIVLVAVFSLGSLAAHAAPTVQITYPEKEQWYCSGISMAAGTAAVSDPGRRVERVYCQLYYYSAGNYTHNYWNWVAGVWQTSPTWDTMVLAEGTNSWQVASGFPDDWQPGRTYALYARVYDTAGEVGTDVNYFYIGDVTPPTISLTILRRTLWPANGKMALAAEVSAEDACDATPEVTIDVASSDTPQPPKKGEPRPDWEIVRDGDVWQVWLRAERAAPSTDRVYVITAAATDDSGNRAQRIGTATVPGGSGRKK